MNKEIKIFNYHKITKEFKFEAAHRLYDLDYKSPCSNNHGHSYKVKVTFTVKKLNQNDMIIDFSELKMFQKWLDNNFDHATIISENDKKYLEAIKLLGDKYVIMKYDKTTAENMAEYFNQILIDMFFDKIDGIISCNVKVFETAKNCATSLIVIEQPKEKE